MRIKSGFEHVAMFEKTKFSQRHLRPRCSHHYAETVLPMRDGLPKLKDFPAEFGGSGEAIAE